MNILVWFFIGSQLWRLETTLIIWFTSDKNVICCSLNHLEDFRWTYVFVLTPNTKFSDSFSTISTDTRVLSAACNTFFLDLNVWVKLTFRLKVVQYNLYTMFLIEINASMYLYLIDASPLQWFKAPNGL